MTDHRILPVPTDTEAPKQRTAAELLREIAARDPEGHKRALGRGYGIGPAVPTDTEEQR